MSWFDRVPRWMGGKAGGSGTNDAPGPTPADQWTVPGIFFDTTGWRLSSSTPTSMTWTAKDATLVLDKDEAPRESAPAALTNLRKHYRDYARAIGEDIVLVEVGDIRPGQALQVIFKRRAGLGCAYRSLLEIQQETDRFRVTTDIDEGGHTGTREAVVNAAVVEAGELVLGDLNPDGSRTVTGWIARWR